MDLRKCMRRCANKIASFKPVFIENENSFMLYLNSKKRRLFRICVSGRVSRILSPRRAL